MPATEGARLVSRLGKQWTGCRSTDIVVCGRCKACRAAEICVKGGEAEGACKGRWQDREQGPSGQQIIAQRLRELQEAYDVMVQVMDQLQGQ